MQKYRFVKFEQGNKWYAQSSHGAVAGLKRSEARLFSAADWQEWGEVGGWIKEELGEDQMMTAAKPGVAGQAELPGME